MKAIFLRKLLCTVSLLLFFNTAHSQQQKIDLSGWNASIYLPADYAQGNKTYPAIIFVPGVGEIGTDYNRLITYGPSAYITQGWDGKALGVQFIVISIQPPMQWVRPWDLKARIDILKSKYRIGTYFMTGLSMGGWASLWYSYYYPNEIPGIVGVESVVPSENSDGGTDYERYIHETYAIPAKAGQHYLLFEQKNNWMRNDQVIDGMNMAAPGSGTYVYTAFNGGGHCCWNEFYGGGGTQPGRFAEIGNKNLYEWMASNLPGTPAGNTPPTANAGANKTITLPVSTVALAGSGSDADGKIASYQWTKISGPAAFSIVSPQSATTNVSGLSAGTYEFQLTVTDDKGATGSATVKVTVNAPANKSPIANAGSDKTITLPTSTISLSGSGTDSDGQVVSYLWTKKSGPAAFSIVSPQSATTNVSGLSAGTYEFQLTVTDDKGATGSATVKITVNAPANKSPIANAGSDKTITLPTNTISLSGSGTDSDGQVVSYLWTKKSGPSNYSIVSPQSATTNVSGLSAGTYEFQLTVTDDKGATGTAIVKVTVVSKANIAPAVYAGPDAVITLPESSVNLSGWAKDDDGTIASYEWSEQSGQSGYKILSPTSINTAITGLKKGTYIFKLKVVDDKGAGASSTVTITVVEGDNPPVANAGGDINLSLPQNTTDLNGSGSTGNGSEVTFLWEKKAGPSGGSIANPTAAATEVTDLTQGVYQFQLTVTNDKGQADSAVTQVTVHPETANIAPAVYAGSDIQINTPVTSVSLAGWAKDVDGSIASYQWSEVSGRTDYKFSSANSINTTVSGLNAGVYVFKLKVLDDKGAGASSTLTVTVITGNRLPVSNAGPEQTVMLPANETTLTGSGTDADGSISSYLWKQVSGPSAATIANINSASTKISKLIEGAYQFELTVTDNKGASNSSTVNVFVKRTNVAPSIYAGSTLVITLPINSVSLAGSARDVDGWIASYQWSEVSGRTDYQFTTPTEANTTVTGLGVGTYTFKLKVIDNDGAGASNTVTIIVNPAPGRSGIASYGEIQSNSMAATIDKSKRDSSAVAVNSASLTALPATLRIYPNPAANYIDVDIPAIFTGDEIKVVITSTNGRMVKSETITSDAGHPYTKRINLAGLSNGYYVVSIISRNGKVLSSKSIIKF